MKTCAYLVNDNPLYLKMAAGSIGGLRDWNKDVSVKVILVDQGKNDTSAFRKVCEEADVEIMDRPYLKTEEGESYFPINKAYFAEVEGDQILFIDTDTFIFGDVDILFDTYQECDVVACENRWVKDGWRDDYLPNNMRPLNSGVMLWKGEKLRQAVESMPQICVDLRDRKYPLSEFLYSVSDDCWNREEFAYSLFIADNGLNYGYFDPKHSYNLLWEQDIEKSRETIILHTYTANWQRVYNEVFGPPKKRIPVRLFTR